MQTQNKERLDQVSKSNYIFSKMKNPLDKLAIKHYVAHLCSYESELKLVGSSAELAIQVYKSYINSFFLLVDLYFKYYEVGSQYFVLLEAAINGIVKSSEAIKKSAIQAELSKYYGKVAIIFKTAADNTGESYYKVAYETKASTYCELSYKGSNETTKPYLEKICALYEKEAAQCILLPVQELLQHRTGELRLPKAIQEGDLKTVSRFVDQFEDLMDRALPNEDGRTAFLEAIYYDQLELIKYFIKKRDVLTLLKAESKSGKNALVIASFYNRSAILKYLLESKKIREEQLKIIKAIDELLVKIEPNLGNKSEKLAAIEALKSIVLTVEGKKTLQENDKKRLEIIHLLELKIEFDMANDVHDAAAELLAIISPKLRPSITERLTVIANDKQVSNPHSEKESARLAPSPHQVMTAQKVIAQHQGGGEQKELKLSQLEPLSLQEASFTNSQIAAHVLSMPEVAIAEERVPNAPVQHIKMEVDNTSSSATATTMASIHSASYPSFWAGNYNSVTNQKLYNEIYQKHFATLSANAAFSVSTNISDTAKSQADEEFQKLFE